MELMIDELQVFFPFKVIYAEQLEYMKTLKHCLDGKKNLILEMPTGTGKTASFFSICLSYMLKYPDRIGKIIYCTRTISQLEKATEELKLIGQLLEKHNFNLPLSTVLSARRTYCIHPEVNVHTDRDKIDAECRKLTQISDVSCHFYTNYTNNKQEKYEGIFNIEDLLSFGSEREVCPYYTSRHISASANIILCNYPYLLD